ncbi:MAG: glycogen/starch/alpha-glucan phosphorylase [Thiomonas sp.]|uniref:glycogen/starch/alpha-glucan phosphorylase n=1 Tax=Thiomonas sp. TaxID=2047785 RepID=UPI002A36508B|nr:glycogen/starch/alpha-glucan phosphorylase [Thiomonas sp.]MDY0331018.1 glycogen/starch/alpha-glucan phosphorylase [Thiomonas sp.]
MTPEPKPPLPEAASVPFVHDTPPRDVESLKRAISNKLMFQIGKDPLSAQPIDWLHAASYAVRDLMVEHWFDTTHARNMQDAKQVYYLSMEFLIGRTFTNALIAMELTEPLRQALHELGVDMDAIADLEPDAALGNGGLGRLAACFLDSMATLGIPGYGYGIRYEYGMFRQTLVDGRQVEVPDYWLTAGNPWEFARPEVVYRVQFGGHVIKEGDRARWVDTHDVEAMAYDTIIPGYDTTTTNTLRLWSAKATKEIDLSAFNRGDYFGAVEEKNHSENVSRVLYPDDSTDAGRELRLHQEYFFCSASVQDLMRRYLQTHTTFDQFADKVAIHLNDTHPVLAIPELMRLFLDVHHLPFNDAWRICQGVFSYTNHTLMSEALETWPIDMLGRVLPRHLQIILDINANFLNKLTQKHGHDVDLMRHVSLVNESGTRSVRMAYLAVLASHSVNGVSALHSELMQQSIFADFARLWPTRFNNKTNGITQRRWLALANPPLAALLDKTIGAHWRRDLSELSRLRPLLDSSDLISEFQSAKRSNKVRFSAWLQTHHGVTIPVDALYDVQVKRIHEYKRQLLNVLHVITRYLRIIEQPGSVTVPRVVIFAGKAASAYHIAKLIIQLINDVARTVNHDDRVGDLLKVVFVPNYGVSAAEVIIPAADLSEQISTAGTEASGTGNMKLALNGALTIGTLDGANVEIQENVGADNMFIFGLTAGEVTDLRMTGYQPHAIVSASPELSRVLDTLRDGRFSPQEPHRYLSLYDLLVNWGDHYMLLADYASYIAAQARVDALYRQPEEWAKKALANVAGMGPFSSDRTIAEYAEQIWHAKPLLS